MYKTKHNIIYHKPSCLSSPDAINSNIVTLKKA